MQPHFSNLNKRITKAPKLHFLDSGLVCYLLGIQNAEQLKTHPLRGAIFESWVVSELLKQRYHQAQQANLYYFRENNGHEIDLVLDFGNKVEAVEIKAGKTYATDFFRNLVYYRKLNPHCRRGVVVYGGDKGQLVQQNQLLSYKDISDGFPKVAER